MTRLDRRITALERQRGVGEACACVLRITILYDDGAVECFNPHEPGQVIDPDSDRCPHGRLWQVERVYDLRGGDNGNAGVDAGWRV